MSNNVKTTEYVGGSDCRLQGSVVKEEPPDVSAISKALHKHELSMLSPNENEMCQNYLSGSFQANVVGIDLILNVIVAGLGWLDLDY